MAFFTAEVLDELAKSTVRIAFLVDFEFVSGTKRVWNGIGKLEAGGFTYEGLGALGSIEGLQEVRTAESHVVTFTVSGIDSQFLAGALAETDDVQGQVVSVAIQLFDKDEQPIAGPIPIFFGIMQAPRITRSEATEEEGSVQSISIPAENLFVGRHRPAAGRYTDREQQMRFPGDRFFAYVPELVSKTIVWPDY